VAPPAVIVHPMFREGEVKPVWLTVRSAYPDALGDAPPSAEPLASVIALLGAPAEADESGQEPVDEATEGAVPQAPRDSSAIPAAAVSVLLSLR